MPFTNLDTSWIDNWFPSIDGIRAKAFRERVAGPTDKDGIVSDHRDGASAELNPRGEGKKAGERPEVGT